MQNINFQGHSSLILSSKNFEKSLPTVKRAHRCLSGNNQAQLRSGYEYITNIDADNLAVIVKRGKNGFVKHVPVSGRVTEIIEEIAKRIDELKETSKEKLTAWIIGGSKIESPKGTNTIEKVNEIADILCDKPDIDTSILAGSKAGFENILLHPTTEKLNITLNKNTCNLEDAFDIVELNNTDII